MSNVFVFRRPPHGVITEYFGGGKGGSSTTTNNVTQIPPEVLARYNAVNARAEAVAQQPYQAYSNDPNAFVAPLNATQQAGIQNTNIMAGAAQPYYQSATNQLMQAQAGAQPGINAAYQNVGQAQQQGQNYLGAATQNVGQAQQQGQNYLGAATQNVGQAQQLGQGYLGAATAAGLAGAQAVDPSQLNVGQYMNPFTQSVVNATQAAMNQQQGQQLSQQQAEAIRSGAFGGERAGLQRGQLRGQQSLAQAQAIAPLYQQNYNQALAAAQQQQGVGLGAGQANRAAIQNYAQQLGNLGQQGYQQGIGASQQLGNLGQQGYQQGMGAAQQYGTLGQQGYQQGMGAAQQQAALAQQGYGMGANTSTLLGSIGTNAQQAGLAGAQAQMQAGQQQQQTQQAGLQAMYNQFLQQQGFPYQQAQFLANIATGTGALSGNASSGTSTTTGGGGFFSSDERLKENIQRVGETDDGQPIYRYNYKGDKNTQIGLLAQDVEKKHPEAVGLAGGYKTVNYKKATEDAVHKAEGGAATDAYAINPSAGNSQMLQENSGKGLGAIPTLPKMVTGRDIPIEAGVNAAQLAALRAPQATGYSLGTREGKQAELDSLLSSQSQPPGPNGDLLGSGPGYVSSRINTLQDWLNKNASPGPQYSSAGGLVGPEGGAFAHGGSFARGGLAEGDYMNPALQFYGRQQDQGGAYGTQLQPLAQRQILQGTPMQAPQQRQQPDAVTSALNMAKLVQTGNEAYKARPDFLRSAADVKARAHTADALAAEKQQYIDWAKEKGYPLPSDKKVAEISPEDSPIVPEVYAARGGLIGDRHHYSRGGINPYGGNSVLGPILEEQEQQPQPQMMKAPEAPGQKPQQKSGGLGELVDTGLKARSLYKGGEWAAGKLGLGAPETAMSATSTGIAGAAPEALSAGLAGGAAEGAALAGGAEAATAAGLAGGAEALGGGLMAAGSAALPFVLPAAALFSLFAKDGGAIKGRDHYQAGGLKPPTEDAPVVVEEVGGNENATTGGGETVVRGAPLARPASNAPTPENAVATVPAPREPKPAPGLNPPKSFFPEITSEGVKDTLSSENFWVPAIAGLGSMLASPNKTLAGAIGSGLVGGTGAYTELQKQNALQTKQRFELAKDLFKGPVEGEDKKLYWRHVPSGRLVPQEEYERLYSDFVRGSAGTPRSTAPSSDTPAVATARSVIAEKPPEPVKAPTVPPASAAAATEASAPVPDAAQAQAGQPPAAPVPAEGQPALKDKTQIKDEMLASPQRWAGTPPERNPILLRQQAARLEGEVRQLRDKARRIATTMPENTVEGPRLTSEANQLDANRKEMIDRSEKILDEAAELAYEDQKAQSAALTGQKTGRMAVPTSPDVPLPQGMTVAQAENDLDYLGSRIESNMKKYNELKARGALKEAGDYYAKVEKDRAQLERVIGTEFTTVSGTVYKLNPNADVFESTPPKRMPADYRAKIDPNTGAVAPKPISEFVGYPETRGHPVDPKLIGKKAIVKVETDKTRSDSIAQSNEAEKEFVNGAEKAQEAIATTLKFSTAAKILESKGANTNYAELANLARGLGMEGLANQIMSEKDTAAAFIALKTNVDQAIQQASAAFTRVTQNEFAVTKKEATATIDAPFNASYSLAQTQMARALWQNALLSDWEKEKRMNGTTNFNAFRDVWQRAHPKAMFEESAARALGNFKGQDLPKKTDFTEGVVYVMPKNAEKTALGKAFIDKGLRPGDLFVMNGVNHQEGDFGEPTRVAPTDAFKVHLRAPVLTYGAR